MPNLLGLAGAQPQKPTRFAPIYNGRWSSGIWTNRSPLRDGPTTRIVEKFYGAAGDALIWGSNVEITNRLTLARRPGNPVFDSNTYDDVDSFYSFRTFTQTQEQIDIMIDQAGALYSLYEGTKTLVFNKTSGSGQSYMQSVGNSLYFADGVDNKKWLQSLVSWSAGAEWNTYSAPNFTTFLIDYNGNIQQLTPTAIPVTGVTVSANVLTVTSSESLTSLLSTGMLMSFPSVMTAAFLGNQTVAITYVSGDTFTANFKNDDYTGTESSVFVVETTGGTNPVAGSTLPTWSTVVPSASNNFTGGVTQDGQVTWTNRGTPVKNWGIVPGKTAPTVTVGTSNVAWAADTFYSIVSVVVDSNGNLQQVTTAGKSSGVQPTWSTSVGSTTTDGSVVWTMIQTAASLVWEPNTAYTQSVILNLTSVANASSGSTVYSGAITGGAANAFAGKTFVTTGWKNIVNNGSFICTASTATTLTLSNPDGVSETNAATAKLQGSFVIGNAAGTNCLFELATQTQPALTGSVSAYLYNGPTSGAVGCVVLTNPTSTGSAIASTTTQNSLHFTGAPGSNSGPLQWAVVNSAGGQTGTNVPFSQGANFQLVILASLQVPVAGTYSFTINHHDGMIWGIGGGAVLVSGTNDNPLTGTGYPQTITVAEGYPVFGGTNRGLEGGGLWTDSFTVTFPTAGSYPVEIDYSYWYHSGLTLEVLCNGFGLGNLTAGGGTPESGANQPIWPAWSVTYAPSYPTVTESNGQLTWSNIGPLTDFAWSANTNFTLPDTTIIDTNGYEEAPYRTGISGTTAPTFATGANQLTYDNPNLIWINQGLAAIPKTGTLSTFNGGWVYGVALVDTLDNTVSNASLLSVATGNFVGVNGVQLAPGSGLPNEAVIDPQADYVAIFRSTDGLSTPFLIPGQLGSIWTIPLSQYLQYGYIDQTPDEGLNNLISAPIGGENTPPGGGAINLSYHLNRIWYSIGNIVYWTAGPDTPAGNGVNGTPPLNFNTFPSLVKRLVPTTSGMMVFTVSDVYLIPGQGTANSPIQSAIPIMQGVGLQSYNALDVNGSIIGFFTTDNQFCILDPSAGVSYAAFPIGDQLRLNNGGVGTSWDASNVYVTWHVDGEDQAWYICDGVNGWYRLMPTPAPEQGYTWSPFAAIVGGVGALKSIEVTPGVHKLLLGPTSSGPILNRDLTVFQDNGESYRAFAIVGSAVLAQPGQVATVGFVTTDSVNVQGGTPVVLGLLLDEAYPYYQGPFDILKHFENDPPTLRKSRSIMSQRFYLSDKREEAVCRHMQMLVDFGTQSVQNELLTLTVFGGFLQEN